MKLQHITLMLAALCAAACIDNKEYNPQLPEDPAITDPKPYALPIDANKTFVHPGCMAAQADFDRAKRHIAAGEQPWAQAFDSLKKARFFNMGLNATLLAGRLEEGKAQGWLIRGSADKSYYVEDLDTYFNKWDGNFDFEYQACSAAYSRAVYWKLTGDTQYADEAVKILNAWAANCKGVTGDNNHILCLMEAGYDFASTAELLRDYNGWNAEDQTRFKTWLQEVFVDKIINFLDKHDSSASVTGSTYYWSNWDLGNMLALMAIGVYCDRTDIYNKALQYVTYGPGNGNFRRFVRIIHPAIAGEDDIDLGQTQEAGRDQGHNLLAIRLVAAMCRIAWNQGDDLYGYDDNRFLKGAEYVAKYNYGPLIIKQKNLSGLTYPFIPGIVNSAGVYHADNSTDGRGQFCSGFVSIYEHYRKYKGLTPRYVNWAAHTPFYNGAYQLNADLSKQTLIEPETYNHNQGAGSSFGTLLFTEDESLIKP